jgi:hypothetical protein
MTLDGGGWTLVEWINNGRNTATGEINFSSLASMNANSKMLDSDIIALARANGMREALMMNQARSIAYIVRYTDSAWGAFSSTGWTNQRYDSKSSSGAWSTSVCNGHVNNRGFSTYSDDSGSSCTIRFLGGSWYATTYHTMYGNVGGYYGVYVR